jgi:hypothetical protein
MDIGICLTCGDACNIHSQNCGSCNRKLTGYGLGWNPAPKRYIEQQLTPGDEPHAADEPFDEPHAAKHHKEKLQKTENPNWELFMLKVGRAKFDELVAEIEYVADIKNEQKKLNYLAIKSNYEKTEVEFAQLIKDHQV